MAICAQHCKVTSVGSPILNSAGPRPRAIGRPDLGRRIDVVEFEHSDVTYSAFLARATQIGDQFALDAPVAFLPTPIRRNALAFVAAISVQRVFATFQAFAVAPAAASIAFARTVMRAIQPIPRWLDIEARRARQTYPVMPGRFAVRRQTAHAFVPSVHDAFYNRATSGARSFDIACERIRKAYAQPDMFVPRPPDPVQEAMFK